MVEQQGSLSATCSGGSTTKLAHSFETHWECPPVYQSTVHEAEAGGIIVSEEGRLPSRYFRSARLRHPASELKCS